MYLNINGLPKNKNHPKNNLIYQTLLNHKADIFGLTETNLKWSTLDQEHTWKERTTGIWESSHSILSYNRTDINSTTSFQPGGTLLHSNGRSCHRIISSTCDPSGLGRWCSTRYRGRQDVTLRVVCVYRPCTPGTAGPSTTYSQHQRYYDENDDNRCPRKAILDDLIIQLNQWKAEGDQLIVMIDCNEDIRSTTIKNTFRSIGLRDAITHNRDRDSPATFHRGSVPIDGIFASSTINMIQGGYLAFGDMPSDHRTLWIDITYENAFGYKMPPIINPVSRRLKSNIPSVRNKFNSEYKCFIRRFHLEEKLYHLQNRLTLPITPEAAKEYEKILDIRSQAIAYADKRCRRIFLGAVPFSANLKQASKQLELWKAVKTKKSGAKYSMNKLRRLERFIGINNTIQLPLAEINDNLKKSQKEYWKVKKKADEHRTSFLLSKAEDIANDNAGQTDTIYNQLLQREKMRQAHRRVKFTINKHRGGGITRVEVLSSTGELTELTTKSQIESACIKENKLKYRQTENTPCMQGQLRRDLGPTGLTESATHIIAGTYIIPATAPPYAQEFFRQFKQQRLTHPPPPNIMTTASFKNGWKKIKETTSAASITGIHFGHLKSSSLDPALSDFEAAISNVPYSTGYNPVQWRKSICCMIKKKADVDLVTKLRTIVLTEADFNFNNKKLGKESLLHAELNDLLAKEQYGSRKGKRSIDHALNKRLIYDIFRQTRKPGALCSNDAKSCYDRVLHSITMLAFRRLGFPTPPVDCMLKAIQQMKHYIRTTFGDSKSFFSSNNARIPFQGILQGNGAAPTIWVLISTPLLDMLRSAQNGAHLQSAISKEPHHVVGFAFVDDTDLVCFNQGNLRLTEEIMEDMQQGIDQWEGGLKLTGGAIVPEKSWIYPIDFDFDAAGKWYYKRAEDIPHQFTVLDHSGTRCQLEKIEPDMGKETLGVILAPDGNNDHATEKLLEKSSTWRDYIITGHLKASEARLALDSTIMRTLSYPLPALTLTLKECNRIMKPVLDAGLAKTHVCRNFPHAVIYGPKKEKGLGIPNLFISQGLSHISTIQQYLSDNNNITGAFLRNSIELLKVELGTGHHPFSLNYDSYNSLATHCWIKGVWKFSFDHDINIQECITDNLKLRRRQDKFIMETIVNLHSYSPTELSHINRCRIHLQATTLADITTACGKHFSHCALHCHLDSSIPHHYNWPTQPRPYQYSRRLWKQAIKKAFPCHGQLLNQRLGSWTDGGRQQWQWFHQPSTGRLFRRYRGRLRMYIRTSRRGNIGRFPRFKYCTQAISLPINSHRATILRINRTTVKLTGTTRRIGEFPPPDRSQADIREFQILRQEMKETSRHCNITDDDLRRALRNNTLVTVSDGSYMAHLELGTAAWILACSRHQYATGNHFTPGPGHSQCSHRSELSGMLGAILHVNDLCKKFLITEGHITLYCDGKGAIDVVSNLYPSINPSRTHFDMLHSIQVALTHSPLTWNFKHVPGHRDDEVPEEELTNPEFWNTIADREAKRKLANISQQENWHLSRPSYLPFTYVTIHHLNTEGQQDFVCSQLSQTCSDSLLTRNIRDYWQKKHYFNGRSRQYIDWKVTRKSSILLKPQRQRWLSKWTSGMCGVGKWLKIWKWQDHSHCPRCGQPDEDVQHVLLCNEISALTLWENSIIELREWLDTNNCDPEMNTAICKSLTAWHNGSPLPPVSTSNNLLRSAILQQDSLSWYSFINGFITKGWRNVQHAHLLDIGSLKSSTLWMTKMQRRIWIIPWSLWEHRNKHLHNDGASIHRTDYQSIVGEIIREWTTGLGDLPIRYQNLFQGTLQHRLHENIHLKLMWLASVWSARDRISRTANTAIDPLRNPTAMSFFQRWRTRAGR